MKQRSQHTLRVLSLVMALVMVLSLVPAAAFAADTDTIVYLKPNSNWLEAGARFAIYCFGNGEKWVSMTGPNEDGLYKGTVPAGYPSLIFCRMNPGTTDNNWNNKWNQTGDLTLPTNGNNCYTVKDGTWDQGGGSWSTFTPTYTVAGEKALCGTDWTPTDDSNTMTKNAETGLYVKTYENVLAGTYQFKVTDSSWDYAWPSSNYVLNLEAISDVTITFDAASKAVNHTAVPVTYIVAGSAGLCGSEWDTGNTANAMTWNAETGLCEKTYESVAKGNYEFKVTDGSWDRSWPGDNYAFTLDTISDVTISFDPASKTVSHTATPTGEEPVTDVTVHFRNTGLWSEVYYHAWIENGDSDTDLTSWPGSKLSENAGHTNWYTVELTNLNAANGIGILFNNGSDSGKTPDIMIDENGEYWYDGALLTTEPENFEDGTVPTVSYSATLHFADSKNWGSVNLYTWTMDGMPTGSWPGTALAQGTDGFYSMTVSYEAPEGQGLNFIFSGSGQTVDLKLEGSAFVEEDGVYTAEKWVAPTTANDEGKFYADIVDAPEAIAVSPQVNGNSVTFQYKDTEASEVLVFGSWDNWAKGIAMEENAYDVWSVTQEFDYGLYEYKFVGSKGWVTDPVNGWVTGKDQNSAFLISNPNSDTNTVKINVHYDVPSAEWNVCAWGAKDLEPQYDFVDDVATITLDGRANQYVAFKVRKSIEGNDWAAQSGEIRVDLSNTVSGTIDVWVGSDFSVSQGLNADVVYANKVKSVELDYDSNTIVIQTAKAVSDAETAFAIYRDGEPADIIDRVTVSGGSTILSLTETMELVHLYRCKLAFLEDINEAYRDGIHVIGTNTVYASEKFGEAFTYDGELGALWTEDGTTFRVWAPTAAAVSVNLYESGTEQTDDLLKSVAMTADENGTWVVTVGGDLNGVYYTYAVTVDGETVEAVDPYARTTGVNGKRGMVIDLDSTDPEGWEEDGNPNPITKYSDAIIYELHVRDFSIDDSSGIRDEWQGKYLAFTQTGTTVDANEDGNGDGEIKSGIDYLEELGVTHLHLLPVYDYGSVDETKCENFNWGYDPVNYNTPEGSYSTDPYNGEVRVKEFKEMVMALHEADISVIMDVVYNHVYDAGKFCVNRIVPKYFSRVNADGSYSNGSGCGNDTASEREMVRKYIVESIMYWKEEYHIDGFRFDLVGLLDATTINEIVNTVHAKYPDVIFYGEGWTLGTAVEPGNTMATQANSTATPEFAYFSDTIRNLLAGSNGSSLGFVSGLTGQEEAIRDNFMAKPWWTNDPQQIVQYASCHDNYTLVDKLILSTGKSEIDDEIIRMNNLAAAVYMTSQGIPFIHAGEEFLREKLEEDGGRCENSYNASDFVNHIEWSNLADEDYAANAEYYKGLIDFRKTHESLRLESREQIDQYVKYSWITNEVVMFTIDAKAAGDISDTIVLIFNANKSAKTVNLPAGEWKVCINGQNAGTDVLATATGSVSVDGISAMVLVQGETALLSPDLKNYEYTVDAQNGTVILTKYTGTDSAVEVAPLYLVDGTAYTTVLDSTTVFRDNTKITSVKISDGVKFKDNTMFCLFYKCSNLVSADLNGLDTAGVTDMSYLFADCGKLTSVDMTDVDLSDVTTTKAMFSYCKKLKSIAGYENWDTSSLEIMYMMFNYVQSMETIDMSKWDLSKIINSGWCFQFCYAKYILLPDNLKTMSAGFLNHATKYEGTTFTIPAGVQKIGYGHTIYDFSDDDFVEFIVPVSNKNYVAIDGILYSADGREMLAVPRGKTFENNTYVIPEGVDFLGELSFSRNYNIHTVVLPNSYVLEYVPAHDPRYILVDDSGNLNAGLNVNIAIYLYTGITDYAVKDDNPRYASVDGILYSKDMTTVVAIPTRYDKLMDIPEGVIAWNYAAIWQPEMNKCPGVSIPSTLTEISQDQITRLNTLNKKYASFEITVHADNPVYGLDEVGNLIVKGIAVARNTDTRDSYATVGEALAAAKAGEKVILLTDSSASTVVVPANVTLDLNGFVMEADNVVSFGAVIDTAETVGGIQIDIDTTKAFTKLQPDNGGYLPVYDTRDGMYKFFTYKVESNLVDSLNDESVRFSTRIVFEHVDAYEILANTGNSGIDYVLTMSWTGVDGFGVRYTMSDATVKEYAQAAYDQINETGSNCKAMTVTVNGVDNLGEGAQISAAPSVETIAEVTDSAAALTYDLP